MPLNVVTLTGTYRDGALNPSAGAVVLYPSAILTDATDGERIPQSPIMLQLDTTGSFTVDLIATDNADIQPAGWAWTIIERTGQQPANTWSFFLAFTDGASQNLADLAPVIDVATMQAYLPLPSGTPAEGDVPIATGAGTGTEWGPASGAGTVTTVSVATANGLAGTVANPTTAPAITLETTVTGLLKGNGTAVSAASAGTDYLAPNGNGSALTGITAGQAGADVAGAASGALTAAQSFATAAVGTETSRAETAEALLAPRASPALTGVPTAPTATPLTANTQVATTAYADAAVAAETSRATTAEALKAPLASPALTGNPTAPTQTPGDSTTKIATDAFVSAAVATETSRAEGAETANATAISTETTRAETAEALALPKAGGTLTGPLAVNTLTALAGATSVLVNASLGNDFSLTLTASTWTLTNPSNLPSGIAVYRFWLTQDGTGSRTLTWGSNYDFGTAGAPTLTTTASKTDCVAFIYNPSIGKLCYAGTGPGF